MALNGLSSPQRMAAFDIEKVRALIADYLGVDVGRVTDDAYFTDLGAYWLDRLELTIMIEDELDGVEITDDDADPVEVVGDLFRHIEVARS
jgi:acyl carrier protein